MTQAIRNHTLLWLGRCANDNCIFDWFAAFFDICSFHSAAGDLIGAELALARSRAILWQQHGEQLEAALDQDLESTPPDLAASMRGVMQDIASGIGDVTRDEIMGALAWVSFIDSMFIGLGSKLLADSEERVMLARLRLAEHERLTSALQPWGLVIPKAAAGQQGAALARVCSALTHINLDAHCEISYQRVDEPGGGSLTQGLVFGVIAAVQQETELEWSFFERDTQHLYEVRLPARSEALVIDRVLGALDAMAGRAHLVLLPELIASPALSNAIARWLANTRNQGRMLPMLVLAGTQLADDATSRTRNSAEVFSGDGSQCMTQYKLNPYTFKHLHRTGLRLPDAVPTINYVENISGSPHRVSILDITGLGRIVVTICEDTDRWRPWHELLIRAGPDICLAPIMNGRARVPGTDGPDSWAWIKESSIRIANEAGSAVLAANSGALLGAGPRLLGDYANAAFPLLGGNIQRVNLMDSGDSDHDGEPDWWLYGL